MAGRESSVMSAASSSGVGRGTVTSIKQRVTRFYEFYNPSCVGSVDAILHTYRGREDDLIQVLVNKYGKEPPSPAADNTGARANGASSRTSSVAQEAFAGHLEARSKVNSTNVSKLEQLASAAALSPQPTVAPDVKAQDTENEARRISKQTTGNTSQPEQSAPNDHNDSQRKATSKRSSSKEDVAAQAIQHVELKSRLFRFYKQYNPSVLPFVDELVNAAADDPEGMIRGLVAQYGPEPAASIPSVQAQRPGLHHFSSTSSDTTNNRPAHRSTNHLQFLKSPSPPKERLVDEALTTVHSNSLSSRLQVPQAASVAAAPQHSATQFEEIVGKLSEELEKKSKEALELRERRAHAERAAELLAEEKTQLQQKVSEMRGEISARSQDAAATKAQLVDAETQLHQLRLQLETRAGPSLEVDAAAERLTSTVAVREHQNRMLRAQLTQLQTLLEERDGQIIGLTDERDKLADQVENLTGQLGVRRLSLVQTNDESRFYAIVEELQRQFKDFYDERRRIRDDELAQYYKEAQRQIAHRDDVIAQLSQAMTDEYLTSHGKGPVAPRLLPPTADPVSQLGWNRSSSTTDAELSLADELARAQLQLAVQQEEHRVLVGAGGTLMTALRPPPQLVSRELEEVRQLKERLALQEAEAKAAKAALSSELGRQVDDLKELHMRMKQYDQERSAMEQEVRRQAHEAEYWREQSIMLSANLHREEDHASEPSGSYVPSRFEVQPNHHQQGPSASDAEPSLGGAGSVNRTTMWSLLYDR